MKEFNEMELMSDKNVSNGVSMKAVADFKTVLKKEKKVLQSLKEQKASSVVIEAQQDIVDTTKKQMKEAGIMKKKAESIIEDAMITFLVVDKETKQEKKEQRKIAFVKNNRPINDKKVDSFISIVANDKYEKAYPIIVAEAQKLISEGYELTDVKGSVITEKNAEVYFVILDGQHRSMAFAKLNATNETAYNIPNVHVREIDNIGEYLVDINNVGTSWSNKDKLIVAALVTKEELFLNIATLLKEGFNQSTAMLIYTGKKLSSRQINKALKGEKTTLATDVIIDIQRGDKFVTLCKAANIDVKFITKRYFIGGFNSYAASTNEDNAFDALVKMKDSKLTERDLLNVKENDDFIKLLKEALGQTSTVDEVQEAA